MQFSMIAVYIMFRFNTANGHSGALHERPHPAIFHPPQITSATPALLLNHLPIGRT